MVSQHPDECFGGYFNGVWDYQDDTADGKHFYKMREERNGVSKIIYNIYIYLFFWWEMFF